MVKRNNICLAISFTIIISFDSFLILSINFFVISNKNKIVYKLFCLFLILLIWFQINEIFVLN